MALFSFFYRLGTFQTFEKFATKNNLKSKFYAQN